MAKRKRRSKTPGREPERIRPGGLYSACVKAANRGIVLWPAFVLLAVTVVLYYPNHAGDYDIWWHLKNGEHFVSGRTWNIDHTVYSWTPTDGDWKYVTWIGSSALYCMHRIGGFAALHLFQFFVLAFVAGLYLVYIRLNGRSPGVFHAASLMVFMIAVNPTAIFIKPELFTLLFFSLAVFLYFLGKQTTRKAFYFYPVLFLVWVNTHGGFMIGLSFLVMMLGLEAANAFLVRKDPMDSGVLTAFAVSAGLSVLATFVNPHGPAYPIETLARMVAGEKSQFAVLTAYINRWQYLFPDTYVFRRTNTAWALLFLEVSVLAFFFRAFSKRRILDMALLAANVLFFLFAMRMARATIYFPAIWLFTVVYLIVRTGAHDIERRLAPAALAVLVAASAVCVHNTLTMNTYRYWFGAKLDEQVPVHETEFIEDHDLPAPFFNDYLSGGYMIWSLFPDYKVFIDPRHRPYEKTGVWDDYILFRQKPTVEGLKKLAGKYPFRSALIHYSKYWDVAHAFLRSPEWRLVTFDRIGAVFVSTSAMSGEALDALVSIPEPGRFADVSNPVILFSLFKLYYFTNDLEKAGEIVHIYENNIGGLYRGRELQLGVLRRMLAGKE